MFDHLIFDWSGTLVNDLPPTLDATNAVLTSYGVEAMDEETFRTRFRLPYTEFYEEVLPGVPVEDLEGIFRGAFNESLQKVHALPFAEEILVWAHQSAKQCYVLSSADTGLLTKQAKDLGLHDHFVEIYAGVIDKRERIHGILSHHDLVPEKTAFIGDMVHDIETARHGGVASVALTTGYDSEGRLVAADPDHLFPSLEAFRDWLEGSLQST